MISFIFEAEQNFTSYMVAMWCTSNAQFTNSNIEHIWKDSQLIHTENIYALLGGFWHGRSFSGTGGEAKFVWCARHTWSLTLEPSVAVMSSSLCCWGVGIFSVVPGFCFCSQAAWKQFLACVLPQGQNAGVDVAWLLWLGWDVALALSGSELIPESIQVCRNRSNAFNIFMFIERASSQDWGITTLWQRRGGEGVCWSVDRKHWGTHAELTCWTWKHFKSKTKWLRFF